MGPLTLNVKQSLSSSAPVVATAKQGERVEVLQTRRSFTRVRTALGIEGWTEARHLLSTEQIKEMRSISEQSSMLPSQGTATVFQLRNVHAAPNLNSPSSHQLVENSVVEVIGHRLAPRVPFRSAPPTPPKNTTQKRKTPKPKEKEKEKSRGALAPPPPPPPPGLPRNWLELSKSPFAKKEAAKPAQDAPPPPRFDDWSLIRTKDGKAGWVMTSSLSMMIPDEVAQYAEGRRITSYFKLGEAQVKDAESKDPKKFHWLWTTIAKGQQNYEFDQIRVFIFNTRRHRYETAYMERNVTGYYPVTQMMVEVSNRKEKYNVPGFSVIIEDKDGGLVKKTYAFEGYRVRVIQKEPWKRLAETAQAKPMSDLLPANAPAMDPSTIKLSWWESLKQKLNFFGSKK